MIRQLLTLVSALLIASPALAGPTPAGDPDVFVEMGYTPFANDFFAPGTYTQGGNTATIALTPSTSIMLTAQGSAAFPGPESGRVIARVTYDYVILLAQISNAPQRIDGLVDVAGSYALSIQSAFPSGFASVAAVTATDRNLFFSQPDGGSITRSIYAGSENSNYAIKGPGLLVDDAYSYNGSLWLAYRGSIQLRASLTPSAPSSAMIDPTVTVDPNALQAAGFQGQAVVLLSPGVGNAANAVPEPAQWALLICGFGLIGAASRRRHTILA